MTLSKAKDLYMIFVQGDDTCMGRVISLTQTEALIHPWNFMVGGIDEDRTRKVVPSECQETLKFDDLETMDKHFSNNYWKHITGGTV
jgi:hypothetical protein